MKILITGANGYLGTGIVKEVLDNGNEVIATDFELKFVDERAEKRPCNLLILKNHMNILKNQMYYCIWLGEMVLCIIPMLT